MSTEEQRAKWREKKRRQRAAQPKRPKAEKPPKKPAEKTVKFFKVAPLNEDRWELIADMTPWMLYRDRESNGTGWINIRLVSVERTAHKASYWLAWNGERFANGKATAMLATHRPALMAKVLDILSEDL